MAQERFIALLRLRNLGREQKVFFQLYVCVRVFMWRKKQFQEFEKKFLHKKRKTAEVFVLADNLTNKMEFEPLPLPYNEPDRLEVGTEE